MGSGSATIVPEDKNVFLFTMMTIIGAGGLFSLVFHLVIENFRNDSKYLTKIFPRPKHLYKNLRFTSLFHHD